MKPEETSADVPQSTRRKLVDKLATSHCFSCKAAISRLLQPQCVECKGTICDCGQCLCGYSGARYWEKT